MGLLEGINPLNSKKTAAELEAALKKFFPAMGRFVTQTKKYDKAIRSLKADKAQLTEDLERADKKKFAELMAEAQLRADYENLQRTLAKIPPEIMFMYAGKPDKHTERDR